MGERTICCGRTIPCRHPSLYSKAGKFKIQKDQDFAQKFVATIFLTNKLRTRSSGAINILKMQTGTLVSSSHGHDKKTSKVVWWWHICMHSKICHTHEIQTRDTKLKASNKQPFWRFGGTWSSACEEKRNPAWLNSDDWVVSQHTFNGQPHYVV